MALLRRDFEIFGYPGWPGRPRRGGVCNLDRVRVLECRDFGVQTSQLACRLREPVDKCGHDVSCLVQFDESHGLIAQMLLGLGNDGMRYGQFVLPPDVVGHDSLRDAETFTIAHECPRKVALAA